MGKVRVKVLGLEEIEKKQKEEQKKRKEEKKKKVRGVGLKGGERIVEVEVSEEELKKQEEAKKLAEKIEEKETKRRFIKVKHPKGKKYKEALQKLQKELGTNREAEIEKAIKLLKEVHYAKFDEAVEVHLNVKKTGLKGEVNLPYGTGKKRNIVVVDDAFLENLEKGEVDLDKIDVLLAHPSYMKKLAKFAKILGPKKLFPNPKQGTLTEDIEEAKKKFNSGLIQWKTEPKFPLIHQMVGRISFPTEHLVENIKAFINSVGKHNIEEAYVKTTMSPSIKLKI